MAIVNQNITTGATVDVLTVPAGKSYAITSVLITNTGPEDAPGAEDSRFNLYAVTGAYSSNASMIVNNALLPGAETFTLDTEKLVLGAGDYFKVSCSGTNSISVVVSYLEV